MVISQLIWVKKLHHGDAYGHFFSHQLHPQVRHQHWSRSWSRLIYVANYGNCMSQKLGPQKMDDEPLYHNDDPKFEPYRYPMQ